MTKLVLKKTLQEKWYHNLLMFLRPVAVLYITAVIGLIGLNNGVVKIEYFIPNAFMWGGMTLYILNGLLDYLNKLNA